MLRLAKTDTTSFSEPHSYKLEALLETFHLTGKNSHQAIDDVGATVSLVRLCAEKAREKQSQQLSFLQHPKVKPFINTLRNNYGELYLNGVQHLYVLATNEEPALVQELSSAYNALHADGLINEIPRLDYVLRYLHIRYADGQCNRKCACSATLPIYYGYQHTKRS